jgi:hypothetical protein
MKHSCLYRAVLCAALFAAGLSAAFAFDFGMALSTEGEYRTEMVEEKHNVIWSLTGIPWVSAVLDENCSLYASLNLSADYARSLGTLRHPGELFQLERTVLRFKPLSAFSAFSVEAGRVQFSDPTAFVAFGLYDGVNAALALKSSRLSVSALYSGFQFKERSKILMTEADLMDYYDADQYFGSKRAVFAAFWKKHDIGDTKSGNTLDVGGIAQIDLRDTATNAVDGEKLHSQYVLAKFAFSPLSAMGVSVSGVFGIKEQDSGKAISYLGDAALSWNFSASRVSAQCTFSSGVEGDAVRPFFPVNAVALGEVFTPTVSGLLAAKLRYQSRITDSFFLDAAFTYFARTTTDFLPGAALSTDSDGLTLGMEIYANAAYIVFSDFSVKLGTGVFIPAAPLKDAGSPVMGKVKATVNFSL